jgi:protocatechuate 3,4-dioxygenase beta subunit
LGAAHQSRIVSGLQAGDDIVPWNPIHVAGPDKGTNACPVCTYEARPAVVIFTRDGADLPALGRRLQNLVLQQKKRDLKGFLVVLNSSSEHITQMALDSELTRIDVCYPDPKTASQDLAAYKINPAALDTIMVYRNYKVTANFVNLSPDKFDLVESAVAGLP